ncbi:hypothetical protein GQ600_6635 [Phytophthora cactorum]|nr:hypothetical protein GQ600_6635 [Phytophthora cactorum]
MGVNVRTRVVRCHAASDNRNAALFKQKHDAYTASALCSTRVARCFLTSRALAAGHLAVQFVVLNGQVDQPWPSRNFAQDEHASNIGLAATFRVFTLVANLGASQMGLAEHAIHAPVPDLIKRRV